MDLSMKDVTEWIILAMIVAGIAQGKNRNGMNWFGLAIIFGPLALIALLFLRKVWLKRDLR